MNYQRLNIIRFIFAVKIALFRERTILHFIFYCIKGIHKGTNVNFYKSWLLSNIKRFVKVILINILHAEVCFALYQIVSAVQRVFVILILSFEYMFYLL